MSSNHLVDKKDYENHAPKVYYAGGWKPEPYEPREASWADESPHKKISDYHVARSDENAYSFKIQCHVTGPDYKEAWKGEEKSVLVSIENGAIVLKNEGEATGAYLKLPKKADTSAEVTVDRPERGGLFVTVPKIGAKAAPEPLSIQILGMEPIVQMDRAPPLEEELARITAEQERRAALKAK